MDAHDRPLRKQLASMLAWEDAHVGFGHAVADLSVANRGTVPPGGTHSVWQLVEHLRLAQRDILEFCIDPAYRERLLADGAAAAAEFGYGGMEGEQIRCVANTPEVHNVVVCTLCSCYPWPILGIPPVWYKSPPYRSRVVREPRAVLAEFGLELPEGTEIRVWDSSADLRYIVLPMRPEGTGEMTEDELADLVSRDCMIGVAVPRVGAAAA